MAAGRSALSQDLFVDTSAWYPLADRSHREHLRIAEAMGERVRQGARIVTTNLVLAETHALLLRRAGREAALTFLRLARQPPNRVEHATADREHAALRDWIERYADQDFSLADAIGFVVMAELGIREALTLDRHFAAAGFDMVPDAVG